jgi:hypothetical protein
MEYETRFEKIVAQALAIWTNNGRDLLDELIDDIDQDKLWQVRCNVHDAAANAYGCEMSYDEWLAATIAWLNKQAGRA